MIGLHTALYSINFEGQRRNIWPLQGYHFWAELGETILEGQRPVDFALSEYLMCIIPLGQSRWSGGLLQLHSSQYCSVSPS